MSEDLTAVQLGGSLVTIDQKVEALRDELRKLKAEQECKLAELRSLFIEKAHATCPIAIGTEVEYEPGKFGCVDQVGYDVEPFRELEADADIHWNVSGRKINKTGELGVKNFRPVGPAYNFVKGASFKAKRLDGFFGITGPDDD